MCLGIPGKVVSIAGDDPFYRTGVIEFGQIRKEVSLAYTPEANIDDYVIVHAGFAIGVVDEEEAQEVFKLIEEMNPSELEELNPQ